MSRALIGIAILVLLDTAAPSDAQVPENQKICGLAVRDIATNLISNQLPVIDKFYGTMWQEVKILAISSPMCGHYMPDQGEVHMMNLVLNIMLRDGTSHWNIFHPHFSPNGELIRTSKMFQYWQPLVGDNWKKEWCGLVKSDRPEELETQGCK